MIDQFIVAWDLPNNHDTSMLFIVDGGGNNSSLYGQLEDWMHQHEIRYTIESVKTSFMRIDIPCPQARVLIKMAFETYSPTIPNYDPYNYIRALPGATMDKMRPWKPH